MNWKQVLLVIVLLAGAVAIAVWRKGDFEKARTGAPLNQRLTVEYKGPVSGLFKILSAQSGAKYDVDPAVADEEVAISAANLSVVQIQEQAAKKAGLRYRPPEEGSEAIRVGPK